MKFAADFRRIAREALTGKWFIAVAVGFVAVILGALGSDGPKVEININASNADVSFSYAGQNIFSTGGGLNSDIVAFIAGAFFFFVVIALVMGIAYFILGSIVGVGYARFNLNLVDRKEAGLIRFLLTSLIGKQPLWLNLYKQSLFSYGRCCLSSPALLPDTVMQ